MCSTKSQNMWKYDIFCCIYNILYLYVIMYPLFYVLYITKCIDGHSLWIVRTEVFDMWFIFLTPRSVSPMQANLFWLSCKYWQRIIVWGWIDKWLKTTTITVFCGRGYLCNPFSFTVKSVESSVSEINTCHIMSSWFSSFITNTIACRIHDKYSI